MAFWMITGGAVLAAWALLSVVGGELTRRTAELEATTRHARAKAAAAK